MGRRGTSRSRTRAESPLYDTRSSKASISKSKTKTPSSSSVARSSGRSHSRSRDHSRGRSKNRDRSYEPPPGRHEIDDASSAALRSLHDLEIEDDDRGHREYVDKHNQYYGYDEDRDDDDRHHSSYRRASPSPRNSRDQRHIKYSHGNGRSSGGRRERERKRERKRRSPMRRGRDYYNDEDEEDQYHKFEEEDDGDYDCSPPRKPRSHKQTSSTAYPPQRQQQQRQQQTKETTADTDPFGLNLCQGSESFSDGETAAPSGVRRSRRAHKLANTFSTGDGDYLDGPTFSEDPYPRSKPKQDHSYASIAVTAIQLLVLMLQLALCGVAPLEVNPMVGPYPDAFSEWGGKNAYLILENQEYWRFITPAFLHVGVLHLLANAFCLLYSSALFEREWGSWTWLFIFFVSEIGCVGVSSVADPDTIAVGSSGALMGLFAAKLAHVLTYTFFDTHDMSQDEGIHVVQLSSVLCGLTLVSLLSSFTYVDWSGHMGGLASGFFAGMLVFARPIRSCCYSLLWGFFGLAGVAGTTAIIAYLLANETEPIEELADACEYFRHLFPEGYDCGCYLW